MVAVNEPKNDGRKVAGAICPGCDHHIMYPTVSNKKPDVYGRELREVFGWCFKCDLGYTMLQFKSEGKWLTHEYRKYGYSKGKVPNPVAVGPWVKGYSLPDAIPVALGPGGDYAKQVDLDPEISKALRTLVDIQNKAAKSIIELMAISRKRTEANNG